ncbi:hypothetical protein PSN13_05094 [Micromonospora saelicesensis]|uniref:Uncharacterized protein n=1 Tax=Micromonospora saelicesensis TaxID=285676 RepID=A0A328NKY5_9ACTN|nr:hypothetical protein PSN13_05094 [Micromonospora saelicesensis]
MPPVYLTCMEASQVLHWVELTSAYTSQTISLKDLQ